MAPLAPKSKRSSKTDRSQKSPAQSASLFAANKKDKRRIKHAQLLSKITKSNTKKSQRRRPSKKLVTTLEALANALPADEGNYNNEGGNKDGAHGQDPMASAVIKRKSLKSRPGALKRRQKVDNEEMARFARNMAQLAAAAPTATATSTATAKAETKTETVAPAPTQKWAALRSFISQTLEKKT